MKISFFFYIFFMLLSLTCCDVFDKRLKIVNNTERPIYFVCCEDSSYVNVINQLAYIERDTVKNKHHELFRNLDICYENGTDTVTILRPLKFLSQKGESVWLYLFSDSLVRGNLLDYRTKRYYTVRKFYDIKYLKEKNWIITIDELR